MGNSSSNSSEKFTDVMQKVKQQASGTRKVLVNPQKKYRQTLLDKLQSLKLRESLRVQVTEVIEWQITEEELILVVSAISDVKNSQLSLGQLELTQSSPSAPSTKHVVIQMGNRPMRAKVASPIDLLQGKERLKIVAAALRRQLNKIYHPFWRLCKAFSQHLAGPLLKELDHLRESQETIERAIRSEIEKWVLYLAEGCLQPYQQWVMLYCELTPQLWIKWSIQFLKEQIWSINNGYMFHMLSLVIESYKEPLKLPMQVIMKSFITPDVFQINPKLQVQNNYMHATFALVGFSDECSPQKHLSQLEAIKKFICSDIDSFQKPGQKGLVYEIDSDNLMGITNFILCLIPTKIDPIHTHLLFLRLIYGDNIYYDADSSSYMLCTLFGAIEFLQSPQFIGALKKHGQATTQANSSSVMTIPEVEPGLAYASQDHTSQYEESSYSNQGALQQPQDKEEDGEMIPQGRADQTPKRLLSKSSSDQGSKESSFAAKKAANIT